MKIVDCDRTSADYIAWYKYRVSFEEKTVRLLVVLIVLSACICMYGSMSNDIPLLVLSIALLGVGTGIWCVYTRSRLDKELSRYLSDEDGEVCTIRFTKHGIQVITGNDKEYFTFDEIIKARELPWYLFIYTDYAQVPYIVDKKKIQTVSNELEPYYIAKKLRMESPDYKFIRHGDLTYVGRKYRRILDLEETYEGNTRI